MCFTLVGLAISYLIRYLAYYVAFQRSGWRFIDARGISIIAFVSLLFGVFVPAGPSDFIGILLRLLIVSVFIIVIFGEDMSEAFGMAMVAAVIEVIAGFAINLLFPWICINPFAIP